jgi:hypothetical protein
VRQPGSGAGLRRAAAGLLAALCAAACASGGRLPAPRGGVAVAPEDALAFHERARVFYGRLALRRFNTLETFNDPVLREHFASEDLFLDYYAELARVLADAHFDSSRPRSVEIQEFLFEDEQHVQIQVRFQGEDGRPLRPDRTAVVRRDRWVWRGDGWWITPTSPEGEPLTRGDQG